MELSPAIEFDENESNHGEKDEEERGHGAGVDCPLIDFSIDEGA